MKTVLVIGATSAIAAACAQRWAAQGARFVLVARNPEKLAAVRDDLLARGATSAETLLWSAEDFAAHASTVAQALAVLGHIDIALLAQGSLPEQARCEQDADSTLQQLAINATSSIALLTLLANALEHQGKGALGVITSVAGDRGRRSNYVYGSAKAAVSTFCSGLRARLYGAGVTVTDIRPGFVASPMTSHLSLSPLLLASPERIAGPIVSAIERGLDVVYVPAFWRAIMFVVRALPEALFKKLPL